MALHWSSAVPQAMQQHGSPPKSFKAEKRAELSELLATLDHPGRFVTSPAFEPKVTKP